MKLQDAWFTLQQDARQSPITLSAIELQLISMIDMAFFDAYNGCAVVFLGKTPTGNISCFVGMLEIENHSANNTDNFKAFSNTSYVCESDNFPVTKK